MSRPCFVAWLFLLGFARVVSYECFPFHEHFHRIVVGWRDGELSPRYPESMPRAWITDHEETEVGIIVENFGLNFEISMRFILPPQTYVANISWAWEGYNCSWQNIPCYYCYSEFPTLAPTLSPTASPTPSPTPNITLEESNADQSITTAEAGGMTAAGVLAIIVLFHIGKWAVQKCGHGVKRAVDQQQRKNDPVMPLEQVRTAYAMPPQELREPPVDMPPEGPEGPEASMAVVEPEPFTSTTTTE